MTGATIGGNRLPWPVVWIVVTLALLILAQWYPGAALGLAALAFLGFWFSQRGGTR